MTSSEFDIRCMERALDLARRGEGFVEPNPMVGCVIAQGDQVVGEGWHTAFGQPHAEIEALRVAGAAAAGATLYTTLEPCCHEGQTGPCTEAILAAGVRRVVAAQLDPFIMVNGLGVRDLKNAGLDVEIGLLEAKAKALSAPFIKLMSQDCPWMIAKWAMSLDGKIATHTGESQWITGDASRRAVHALRGRVDAILVGRNTAVRDNPLLTARPPGPRVATRVVLDSKGSLPATHQLATTAGAYPTLILVGPEADLENCQRLLDAGCEVFMCESRERGPMLREVLSELAARRFTNVLVEGGGEILGSLLDARQIDEVHVFIAPKLIGGAAAVPAIGGQGAAELANILTLQHLTVEQLGADVYLHGRTRRNG
jgi:diaminohydroxyphosphoribosylaminopyrimidine deaminase/5-amino-6-(5-phosphoribosylamino)uracil reductase